MAKLKYYVRENDCGYMPDSDPAEFDTLREAKSYARSLRQEWQDLQWEDQPYNGNHITVWEPLKSIKRSDLINSSVIYASIDTTIDRVIVISAYYEE